MDLVKGENSFETIDGLAELIEASIVLNQLPVLNEDQQISALSQAWQNIDALSVNIDALSGTVTRTGDLTASDLADLETNQPRVFRALLSAQMLEADFLAGGNPVEQRRRDGMLSNSVGESAQFYRTSKPLVLPVCREAAVALRGIISYSTAISR